MVVLTKEEISVVNKAHDTVKDPTRTLALTDNDSEMIHAAIKDSAPNNDDFLKGDSVMHTQSTPPYQSHTKQAEERGIPLPHRKGHNSSRPKAQPEKTHASEGSHSFDTFGVEPLGPDSWKLDSPRSLEVLAPCAIGCNPGIAGLVMYMSSMPPIVHQP